MKSLVSAILFVVLLLTMSSRSEAQSVLRISLESGRVFHAQVDPRSDSKTLWLRFERGSTRLLRPVQWAAVREVSDGDEILAPAEVLTRVVRQTPPDARPPAAPRDASAAGEVSAGDRARAALGFAPRIRSISVTAYLANWDADAQNDGLAVRLELLDADGQLVAAAGTAEITVTAPRQTRFSEVPHGRGLPIEQFGRWTRRFTAEAVGRQQPIRLAFRDQATRDDDRFQWRGRLHARVTIPGHGVFEATQEIVRIRPFSPIRDWGTLLNGDG